MGVKSLFLTNHLLGKDFIPALHKDGGRALQSATKTADKNNGGQALDLLTIALKTDSGKTTYRGILQKVKHSGLCTNPSAK